MSTTRDARAAEVFMRAMDLPTAERSEFLNKTCADDALLRAEVDTLLAADADLTSAEARSDPDAARIGTRVGSYRLVRVLGSGGMGTVYEAEQDSPRRAVALKLMRPGIVGPESLRRFEYESGFLARLRHPGIAQVFEAGTHALPGAAPGERGVPFFAMEFVEGARTITEFSASRGLSVRQRLELMALVCDAVHHGHTKGVIHRDLKPGNILVDTTGQPKIIDFGVARATDSDVAAATINTGLGQLIGTLNYMSPEQCEGDPQAIDTRSDVYSLGVVLYELLTARLPYDLGTRGIIDAPRIIREQAPTRMSTIDRALRGDVETLVLKALEKDRERRYASAAEFAADLRRYLNHEPIAARPASGMYQFRMFTRRHKGLVSGLAAAFAALAVGLAAALVQTARAHAALADSQLQAYIANIAAADGALRVDDGGTALARLAAAPEALRGWEWRHLLARSDRSIRTMILPGLRMWGMAVSPDGNRMIVYQGTESATLVDIASGASIWSRRDLNVFLKPFSREGAYGAGFVDQDLVIFDSGTGQDIARIRAFAPADSEAPHSACFHPDGRRIAVASGAGHVVVWDWRDARKTFEFTGASWIWELAFSPDGSALAFRDSSTVKMIEPDSGRIVREFPIPTDAQSEQTRAVRFSPDGSLLAVSHGRIIQLWDPASGQPRATIPAHAQRIFGLAFNTAGTTLASVSADRTVRLWDVAQHRPIDTLVGHTSFVSTLGFCLSDTRLVTGSDDRTIKFWDLSAASPVRTVPTGEGVVWTLAFTPDGSGLFSGVDGIGTVLDRTTLGRVVSLQSGPKPDPSHFSMSPDGFIAGANYLHSLTLYDSATGERVWSVPHPDGIDSIDFSADGRLIATAARSDIRIFERASGALLRRIGTPDQKILGVRFHPRSSSVASVGGEHGLVQLWDAASGALIRTLPDQTLDSLSLAFSRDGSFMAVGTGEGTVVIWDTGSWSQITTLPGMQPEVWSVAFSPDGARLAAGSKDGAVHIWDTGSWRELLQLRGHVGTVRSLAWSPDGRTLASGGYDQTIKLWDAPSASSARVGPLAPAPTGGR